MLIKNKNKNGFTLIELMVSIGLFSVVLTAALGSILTIADSNKKARSLMSVTTNLNFAVDSITRSFKAGDIGDVDSANIVTNNDTCLTTEEINYSNPADTYDRRFVKYCLEETGNEPDRKGSLTKSIGNNTNGFGDSVPLTSPDIDIDYLKFAITGVSSLGEQPLASMILEGTVKVSPKISSKFSIQTSVSQRKLNI